jgi:CubicO group peptidase (beta-lactamase class C family)
MRSSLLLFVLTAVAGVSVAAGEASSITRFDGSTITTAEIDGTVTRLMKAAEVTGVAIAIFNQGKVVYLKTYGVRDKEKNLPLTAYQADGVRRGAAAAPKGGSTRQFDLPVATDRSVC